MRWFRKLSGVLVIAIMCSIVLQNIGILEPIKVLAAEQENSMKLNDFEDLRGWTADPGVTAVLADNPNTEGLKSVRVTFDQATKQGRWIFFKQGNISPTMDLSTVRGLYVDIYPTSATTGSLEPLDFNVKDSDGNTLYEQYFDRLVPNQWNTVFIDLSPKWWLPGDNKKISQIGFFIDMETDKLEGRTNVTYYIDNMRIATPSEPVITASQEAGSVLRGSAVSLETTTEAAIIFYTTDGSNPITSVTKQEYTQPIVINNDMTITAYMHKEGMADSFLHVFRYTAYDPTAVDSFMKLDGFETLSGWAADKGVTINPVNEPKSEGSHSVEVNFDTATAGAQWIFFAEDGINPTINLSAATSLAVDIYPTSQTSGAQEPLIAGVYADNTNYEQGMVYEGHVGKLIANQWNTVFINLKNFDFPGDRNKIDRIGFLIDKNSNTFEGRTSVKYYIDNLRVVVPSSPVIIASTESGAIPKGTQVSLTTGVEGGKIYYTTDGSNPISSATKQEFTDPMEIDSNTILTAYVAKEGQADSFLHIFRYKVIDPLNIQLTSQKSGNIFTGDENCDFNLTLSDLSNQSRDLKVSYKVTDYKGNTVFASNVQDVGVEANSTESVDLANIPVQKMGVYNLNISIASTDGLINEQTKTSFSKVLPLIPVEQRAGSIFGACTHFGLGRGAADKNFPIAALGGLFNVRDEMTWGMAETTKGVVTIDPAWEAYVNTAVENGLEPLIILDYGNAFYDERGIPYTQEGIDAYVRFATTVVHHFKDRVKHWEIWNEPNMYGNPSFNPTNKTPEDYAKVLKAVYTAIKAEDPDSEVIGGAVAGADFEWIKRFLQVEGTVDSMDALSIHPYTYPITPEAGMLLENMKAVENMVKQYGNKELPLWITEIGWPTHVGEKGISELESANYAVRSNVLALTYDKIEKLFWYDLQNDGSNISYNEDNFGLIRYWNDKEAPWGAKLGLVAYNAMSHELTGAKYVDQARPDTTLNLYKFHRDSDNRDIVVAWNEFSTKTIGLNAANGMYKVTDIFGNSSNYIVNNGVLTVSVSDSPVYIEGTGISQLTVTTPEYNLASKKVNALGGSTVTIEINRSQEVSSISGQVEAQLPDGWQLVGSSSFTAGTDPIELKINVPEQAPKTLYDIGLSVLSGDGNKLADLVAQVNVTEPVQISMVPKPVLPVEAGKWSLEVTVTNLLDKNAIQGNISILEPNELAQGTEPVSTGIIAPLGTKTLSIPMGATEDKLYNLKVKVELDTGYSLEAVRNTSFLAAAKSQGPITIDGNISDAEWAGSSQFKLNKAEQVVEMTEWGGVDDLSGTGQVKWDSDNLYIAFSATDDTHNQQGSGSSIWQGDAIQFTIDTSRINGAGSAGYHEIGVGLGVSGVQKYRWTATNGKTPGDFNEMQCSIVRNEDTRKTDYEIAVPWTQLLPESISPSDGELLGFSLLLNENDTGTRNGWLEYMSGIGLAKNPNMFGDLILAPAATSGNGDSDDNGGGNSNGGNVNSGNSNTENDIGYFTISGNVATLVLDATKAKAVIMGEAGDKVVIDLSKIGNTQKKAVEIPLDVLNMAKDKEKYLEIKSDKATLLISKDQLDQKNIKDSVKITINDMGKANSSEYTALSNIIDISIKSGDSDISLIKHVNVTLNTSGIKDPRKAGAYYYNEETEEWEYVGGKYDKESSTITFEAKHFSTYTALEYYKTFDDIKDSWAKDAVEVIASRHIVQGYGKNYAPEKNITRAEFASILVKLLGLPYESYTGRFLDVKEGAWYADILETAYKTGIMVGDGKNMRPESYITREEMAVAVMKAYSRYASYTVEKLYSTGFADDSLISSWAKSDAGNAKKIGIVKEAGGNIFNPKGLISRAEAATVIYNLLQISGEIYI